MAHPREDELVASLPAEAQGPLRQALSSPDPKSKEAAESLKAALKAVGFPEGRVYPLPASLTAPQRALAEVLAYRDGFSVYPAAMPAFALRRRWLGLEPGGVLESEEVDVEGRRVPLWHGMQLAGFDYARMGALLNALPADRALRAYSELYPFGYNLDANSLFTHGKLRYPAELHGEGRAWAVEQAERWSKEQNLNRALPMRWLVFTALVRAQVPLEPAWDVLLPLGEAALTRELVRAIPPERRAAAVVAALGTGERPSSGIGPALEVLEELPLPEVAAAVLAQAQGAGEFPGKADVRPRLEQLAARHPVLRPALGLPVEPAPAPPTPSEPAAAPEPQVPAEKPSKARKPPARKPAEKPAPKKPAAQKPEPKKPARKESAAKPAKKELASKKKR